MAFTFRATTVQAPTLASSNVVLSPFQQEKFEYYFRFLVGPSQEQTKINTTTINNLMDRILDFTGWDEEGTAAKECREIHDAFFEIVIEKAKEDFGEDGVDMECWLAMWSHLLIGCMGMHNFPVWLRLLPKVLFKIIDRKNHNILSANDLAIFYRDMVRLDPDQAQEISITAYEQMTDNGHYPLNVESYEQLFANFLLGRTPYGPGRYIFGCFEHKVRPFKLIQPMPEPTDNIMEIRRPSVGRRPSKQLVSFS